MTVFTSDINTPPVDATMDSKQSCESGCVRKPIKAYLVVKRAFDIVVSAVALIVLLLPMLAIALAIKLEAPGPAIYVHNRFGKNGKPLPLLKFRSMFFDADKMIDSFTPEQMVQWKEKFKLDNDPRITRVGKFLRRTSLDELPQLVNILKGDLSFVGPRPIVAEELEKYGENRDKFLSATPGLSGYWQVYARSSCTYDERMKMELFYVDNACLRLDIKIIFATFGAVIRGDGAQ